jgi:NhaA family Na+:H+ antiporter
MASVLLRFLGGEAAAGVLLFVAASAAMVLANSPWEAAYHGLLHRHLDWTPIARLGNLHEWIGDALMAVFFFTVGLEIKREAIEGELSTPQRRRLPVLAALAGMALPALLYLALGGISPHLRSGWAIPAATDIAFALGVLALLGKRAPPSLRLFLLAVAIADDLGAVAIIALAYTSGVVFGWLVLAVAFLAAMALLNRLRLGNGWAFAALAVALWYCTLHSGIHATIAGVAAAFAIPMRLGRHGDSLLLRMEHALAPWTAYVVVPLFGFANAGTSLHGTGLSALLAPLPLAIAGGLFLGKQAGILGAVWLAQRCGYAARPAGASWVQLWGMAVLCGIGFTMSLFIAALAFPLRANLAEQAKLGILAGSLLSAIVGLAVLWLAGRKPA